MFAFLRSLSLGLLVAGTVTAVAEAKVVQIEFEAEYSYGIGFQPLPFAGFPAFVSGSVVHDTSGPLIEDGDHNGPIYRRYGATQSFDLTFHDAMMDPLATASVVGEHPEDQATIVKWDSFARAYFRTLAMDLGPINEALLLFWMTPSALSDAGVEQLNQTMLEDELSAHPHNFELQLSNGDAWHMFELREITLTVLEHDTPAVPLPAALPLALTALGGLAWAARRRNAR